MEQTLCGVRVAIVVEDGFEQVEMTEPREALEMAGASTFLLSPIRGNKVKGWQHDHWGDEFAVDGNLTDCQVSEYDALLLPGGVMSPDKLRIDSQATAFIRSFVDAGKPIAAICHGPWTLVEIGAVKGKTLTSWPSLQTDIRNAGGNWVDQEVVRDGWLITSRKPDDIPAFNREIIQAFARNQAGNGARHDVDHLAEEDSLTSAPDAAMARR